MLRLFRGMLVMAALGFALVPNIAKAMDVAETAIALRISAMITGGTLPTSDPIFAQMVAKVKAGDNLGAAQLAANSKYFASYLGRRLALQMMTPALTSKDLNDNDASAFLIAKFVGGGGVPASISKIWSENSTYAVNVGGVQKRAAALTPAEKANLDWAASLVKIDGQQVKSFANNAVVNTLIALPAASVGGYTTLSDRINDSSYAMWAASAGTNLRFIEGIWEIGTGLSLLDVASTKASQTKAPRFVPLYDPNFFKGEGQPACISCHGGGMANLTHGYSAVANIFDFDAAQGFAYNAAPAQATSKGFGSDSKLRADIATCNLVAKPTTACNPDSTGIAANGAWDVEDVWRDLGVLDRMGWRGPTSGQGLNALGVALGQADIVYENFAKRIVEEVCPMGMFTESKIENIGKAANPATQGTDDIRTIVAMVASDSSCL